MRKLWLALAALGGCSSPESQALKAYRKFADAIAWGRFDEARAMAETSEVLDEISGSEGEFQHWAERGAKIAVVEYEVRQMAAQGEGEFVLHAQQVVKFDPKSLPGNVTPTLGRQHVVRLRRVGDDWKVVAFEERSGKIRQF
jgi:hypothetical protein